MWLYLPSESEVSAQVLQALTWELRSPSEDPELWCYASGTATQQPLWWHGWKERPWIKRLSGIELTPSQQQSFTDAWTSYARAIPASLSVLLESAPETKTRGTCGHISGGLSLNPRCRLCSWKTWPDIYGWDSDPKTRWRKRYGRARRYTRTFARWISRLQQDCLRRRKQARRMKESGFSSWPTARAEDSESCGNHSGATDSLTGAVQNWAKPKANDPEKRGNFNPADQRTGIAGQCRNFPTPNSNPTAPNASITRENGRQAARITDQCLDSVARNFPAPMMQDSESAGSISKGTYLTQTARNFPTPNTAQAVQGSDPRQPGDKRGGLLVDAVREMWATPAAANFRSGEVSQETHQKNSRPLQEQVTLFFHQQETTLQPGQKSEKPAQTSGPQLNPAFVCWMMGLPPGWTNIEWNSCGVQEMELYLSRQRWHLQRLFLAQLEAE